MPSRPKALGDALVAALVALNNSTPFTAWSVPVFAWWHRYALEDLGTLRLSVVPGPIDTMRIGRKQIGADTSALAERVRDLDIITQQRIEPEDVNAVDPLVALQEEFGDRLIGGNLDTGTRGTAVCLALEMASPEKAALDRGHLNDLRVFTAVLRTHWTFRK